MIGRFVDGLETPSAGSEFQRADIAPRDTLGDGLLDIRDWVQAGRCVAGLDPVVPAGGPTGPSNFAVSLAATTESSEAARAIQPIASGSRNRLPLSQQPFKRDREERGTRSEERRV